MITIKATDVRKEWSTVLDSVIREKPKFIKRTHDYMFLSGVDVIRDLLSVYNFSARIFVEDDGSVTLALNEIDLVENAINEGEARLKLAQSILEYAENFYSEYSVWSSAPNRKPHIPYVFKALIINDCNIIGGLIQCHHGEI